MCTGFDDIIYLKTKKMSGLLVNTLEIDYATGDSYIVEE
jgi:hypothetical protein